MALILKRLYTLYANLDEFADSRAEEYTLVKSYYYIIGIVCSYLLFVFKIGPYLMKDRPPMEINRFMMFYNIAQVLFNMFVFYEGFKVINHVNMFCHLVDYSDTPLARHFVYLHYLFFLNKAFDLVDTIIMVLRKRTRQITFLHVYHHVAMCAGIWLGLKYIPCGQGYHLGFVNCIVHIIMYFYYFLTLWNPELSKAIWLKKYITKIQIAQHIIVTSLFAIALISPSCVYPKFLSATLVSQGLYFIAIFTEFYYKSYVWNKK